MKVLFLEPYPIEGPSSRYRVEQYIPYLKAGGVDCRVRPFVFSKFYRILYEKGFIFKKIGYFLLSSLRRVCDIPSALCSDIIFVHLEAFPFGPPLFEYFFALCGKKVVYDLDDAIYLRKSSPTNIFLKHLKCPGKIPRIIKLSCYVITCNSYLAEYASTFNKRVTVIHTCIDTDKFYPRPAGPAPEKITLGWIGSHSTAVYLTQLKGVLSRLAKKFKFTLKIIGAGWDNFSIPGAEVILMKWSLKDEVAQFQSLDIGVYPLPEDEWVYGKTGFKTIQYMSVGIPCVVSRIGTNADIVTDGVNGYLAGTEDEWVEKLSRLMEDAGLRKRIGLAGRKTVEDKYSLRVSAPRVFSILEQAYKG